MKIYLADQTHHLSSHLARLKLTPVMKYDQSKLPEKISSIELETKVPLANLDLGFFFRYQIFPAHIMSALTEWEGDNMKVGDTIVQQVYLPPIKTFSQKIIFGVRINEIIDTPGQKGFSYETLEGHAEKGISTFLIEQNDDIISFKIKTRSTAGNFLAKITAPFFTFPYQAFCTRAALLNVKSQIIGIQENNITG